MLRRCSIQVARLAAEGQGAALWQTLGPSQPWQAAPWQAAPLPPLLPPNLQRHLHGSGLRWRSDLVQHKQDEGSKSGIVYEGPFSNAVLRVKKLSLFSCVCALGAGPVIFGLDVTTTTTAKVSIVATLASFGVFTTGLLSWFTQPYVQRLRYERDTDTLEATTVSLLARTRTDRFHVGEVGEAGGVHPLTTFQARGRRYYIDADNFPDKALLARLVPQTAAVHVMDAANQAQQAQQQAQQQAAVQAGRQAQQRP